MIKNNVSQKVKEVAAFREQTHEIAADFLVGYEKTIDDVLTAFLASGHVLLIGLPGLAKTLLVKTLSKIWGLQFSRVQFTPDLLPADITGTEILQEKPAKSGKVERVFEFRQGPLFAQLVLADEINRTPPKTQAALLQAMEEAQITVGNHTHSLPLPFMVMATQNPIELEGTYPLPEAQLDRFLLSLEFAYPDRNNEKSIAIINPYNQKKVDLVKPIAHAKKILEWREMVYAVLVPDSVLNLIVDTVRNTRPQGGSDFARRFIDYGAGPRATQYLVRAAQARALILGENTVTAKIVKDVYKSVLRHRIMANYLSVAEKISIDEILENCLAK